MVALRVCLAAFLLSPFASSQGLVPGPTLPFAARAVGDVDGDGFDDFAGATGGNLVVHSGATGTVIPHMTRPAAGFGYFGAGDTDADGHDDVVHLDVTATLISGADGTTRFVFVPSVAATSYNAAPGGADLDADGFGDVVLVSSDQIHEVRSGRTGGILFSQVYGSLFSPTLVSIGDTNGDGYDDVSIAVTVIEVMHVLYGPSFTTAVFAASQPRAVGDVNGNGATDRALRQGAQSTTNIVDGATGTMLGTLPYVTFLAPTVTNTGDVDGDGRDDMHVFQPPMTLPPSPGFSSIVSGATLVPLPGSLATSVKALGDVDGDGRVEVVSPGGTITEWVDPAVPTASKLKRRGSSGTTSLGTKPRITTRGSCALGRTTFLDVRGTLPTSISLLVIGGALDIDLAPFGASGNRVYANPDAALLVLSNTGGLAVQSFTMPTSPTLLGATVSVQAVNVDPAAPNAFGLVWSNAIDVATNN